MNSQQVSRTIVGASVIAMAATLFSLTTLAQETAPQPAKQPDQSATQKSDSPAAPATPETSNQPQMVDGAYVFAPGIGMTPPKVIHAVDPKYPGDGVLQNGDTFSVVELVVDEK